MGQEDESGEFHDYCDGIQSVDKFKHTDLGVPALV